MAKRPKESFLRKLGGRPSSYKSPKDLEEKIREYFDLCGEHNQLPEKAGLCIFLGISRDTYSRYRKKKEFSDTIKRADGFIESCWVRRLGGQAATGAIFYLKNAFKDNYRDRHETDLTSKGKRVAITGMQIVNEDGSSIQNKKS